MLSSTNEPNTEDIENLLVAEAFLVYSDEHLAKITGIHKTTWYRYSRGIREPGSKELKQISAKLNISVSQVIELMSKRVKQEKLPRGRPSGRSSATLVKNTPIG